MKAALIAIITATVFSCTTAHELQAELVDATLIKVDNTYRYPDADKKMLTWYTSNKLTIVTFEPSEAHYPLGTKMKMMIPR